MNRRTAMLMTMLMGGALPRGLFGQVPARSAANGGRARGSTSALEPSKTRKAEGNDEPEATDHPDEAAAAGAGDDFVQTLPAEPGQRYRQFDISRYTRLDPGQTNPQNAILEWIFRRTTTAPWHGEKLAVLSASKSKIRAYNSPKVLDETAEVIERFVNAQNDFLEVHVRFVAAIDTRWRYTVYSNLTRVASGAQGQQIWVLNSKEAALALAQMQLFQGYRLLMEKKLPMVNGQTLTIKTTEARAFTGGMQRESAGGVGFQPKAEQLEEGVVLKFSPLLAFEDAALDAAIDLSANTVKSVHKTRIIAPREVGPAEMSIDVPEVVESRLSQTVKDWPIAQTLLISAGIHPGILQNKGGFMNLRIPGTVPGGTELLVFIDVELAAKSKRTAARD